MSDAKEIRKLLKTVTEAGYYDRSERQSPDKFPRTGTLASIIDKKFLEVSSAIDAIMSIIPGGVIGEEHIQKYGKYLIKKLENELNRVKQEYNSGMGE